MFDIVFALNLNSNGLTTLNENAFIGLNSLTKLHLRNTKSTIFNANSFNGLKSLIYLDLRSNHLTKKLDSLMLSDHLKNKLRIIY